MPPKPVPQQQQQQQQPPQQQNQSQLSQAKQSQQTQQSPLKQNQQQVQQVALQNQSKGQGKSPDPKGQTTQQNQSPSKSPLKQPPNTDKDKKPQENHKVIKPLIQQQKHDDHTMNDHQLISLNHSYVVQKLKSQFAHCTDSDKIKDLTKDLFNKITDKYVEKIVKKDNYLNEWPRDITSQLNKWRKKERKAEIQDQIQQLTIKDFLTKQQIQAKMKVLEDNEYILGKKDADKEIENILGMKLPNKYRTITVGEDVSLNESTMKDKNYFIRKQEREEQEQKAREDADSLLRRLKEEKRIRKEKKRREKQEKMLEQKRMEDSRLKHDKDKEIKEIEEKRKRIQDHINRIKEDRETSIQQMLQEVKRVQKNPMYRQIELKYKEDEETEIEKRKKHLQSIRELKVSIGRDEIYEHSRKMEEIVKEKLDERRKNRLARMAVSYDYSQYQTKFLDQIKDADAATREEQERKEEERRRVIEQREIYDKYVKEMHWPKVSEKKRQELEQLKQSIRTSPMTKKSSPVFLDKDSRNDDGMSSKIAPYRAASEHQDGDSTIRRKVLWPENPLKPKPIEKREGKIVDFLKEQRQKKEQDIRDGNYSPVNTKPDWQREIKKMHLSGKDKYDIVLDKAKNYEEKAKRKQQMMSIGKTNNIEDIIELNDMYVESIKAKLELLNDIDIKKNK